MDYAQAPAIATLDLPDTHAKIITSGDEYVLWWTDRIASEWIEPYADLSIALTRLAVLHHCIDTNSGFTHTAADFTSTACGFASPAASFLAASIC